MLQRDEFVFRQHAAIQQRPYQRCFRITDKSYRERAAIELSTADADGSEVPVVGGGLISIPSVVVRSGPASLGKKRLGPQAKIKPAKPMVTGSSARVRVRSLQPYS